MIILVLYWYMSSGGVGERGGGVVYKILPEFRINILAYICVSLPLIARICVLNVSVKRYFGGIGADVEIVTTGINYFGSQADLADVKSQLAGLDTKSPYIQVRHNFFFSLSCFLCVFFEKGEFHFFHVCISFLPHRVIHISVLY